MAYEEAPFEDIKICEMCYAPEGGHFSWCPSRWPDVDEDTDLDVFLDEEMEEDDD